MPAIGLLTATLPMVIGVGATIKVTEVAFRKRGKPVGTKHYHYKGMKTVSHRHEGGHLNHYHKGLKGYGRTKKTLRR